MNMYVVTALASGVGKSPADRWIVGPLRDLETAVIDAAAAEHRMAVLRQARAQETYDRVRKSWAAGAGNDEEMAEADLDLADAVVEPLPRFIADDATPEALSWIMAEQRGRIAILSTEAALFDLVVGPVRRAGQDAQPLTCT